MHNTMENCKLINELDEKRTRNETTQDLDINSSIEIISVRSEESILQQASQEIKELSKLHPNQSKFQDDVSINNIETAITKSNNDKESLQDQVKTGEITPFQAIEKHNIKVEEGSSDKLSNLLDLQTYFQRQAEFAKQKRTLKQMSKPLNNEENNSIPKKKMKIEINKPFKSKNNNSRSCSSRMKTNSVKDLASTSINANKKECISIKCDAKDNVMSDNEMNRSGSEYFPSDDEGDSDMEQRRTTSKKIHSNSSKSKCTSTKKILDDGNEQIYLQRVNKNKNMKNESVHMVDNLFKVPQSIWKRLYKYQKVSVQWLWELHNHNLGGLLGDEMGLGKTIQVIAFLAGLDCSELLSDGERFRGLGPTLIICPATLMEQWVKHFHDWWPILRVAVLHHCGTYDEDPESLISSLTTGGILVTSYSGMLKHNNLLTNTQWHYVILDEGHKIRNPQAKISKAVKAFSTPHRLLLTGSPMQNSLKELWSLFDFILPGKLGTLPVFLEHCAAPITRGGYTNATSIQQATALQIATMLKDAITPYLLRRTKANVQRHLNLPEKNEQILFCTLTDEQRKLYKKYLLSEDVSFVLHERSSPQETGRYRARLLIALSALRKICNHPDLYLYTNQMMEDSDADIDLIEEDLEKFGYWKRAGKMVVVQSLLKIWKKQGHRVLLFTQGRQMMHILESLLQRENHSYLRMDGTTPMSQRQETIYTFNNNTSYFIFLLTTRVGGLGVNLTGADRVVIYDPDWNPATDAQARERAWRIGQNKNVTIYRLITAGTIEEKIYHRQIFKLLLSNKVLDDPRQRKIFKTTDLVELFNLNEPVNGQSSESDRLFKDSKLIPTSLKFSSNKIKKMKKLASTLSKNISKQVIINDLTKKTDDPEDNISITNKIETNNLHSNENNLNASEEINSANVNLNVTSTLSNHSNNNNNNNINNILSTRYSSITLELDDKNTKKDDLKIDSSSNMNSISKPNHLQKETSLSDRTVKEDDTSEVSQLKSQAKTECFTDNINETKLHDNLYNKNYHKKKKSRTEKHNISALFEGEHVSYLIGRRLIKSHVEESPQVSDDEYVLKKLFANSTVSSAFEHEAVLSNTHQNVSDENVMQRLAREAAQESMDFVRKSRKWCSIPTWNKS
ncbi:PREDICTED: DNA excision repair protein ERCC-6 isoform X1 [Polistes canadensis]|uniref:DNA excision repair protein ERCC-6 isoform X1 n=1 Tax=Polistes canadensis TaxID=91411 RepID=UPI000718E8EA|nr:PREDICTED: DNA excision repair protein ERCC-6 isoform X1 [Polistes canadensis]XP_014603044.1 PREDICTED: DNA excision repair protein ERCC-6 isoform X1 [Polistes canadensis]